MKKNQQGYHLEFQGVMDTSKNLPLLFPRLMKEVTSKSRDIPKQSGRNWFKQEQGTPAAWL